MVNPVDAQSMATANPGAVASPSEPSTGSPTYVIPLRDAASRKHYLDLPVRPGDTIYVPRAGNVIVVGWVYSPHVIEITPGMTLLQAISACGGPLFAADSNAIKIIRRHRGGGEEIVTANLNAIKELRTPDVPIQANDVVEVEYDVLRIPGYAVYAAVNGLISFAPAALLVSGL